MRDKPRIYKGTHGWTVIRPRVGFGEAEVVMGFPSWKEAADFLKQTSSLASASSSTDRTTAPGTRIHRSGWGADNWPGIIR